MPFGGRYGVLDRLDAPEMASRYGGRPQQRLQPPQIQPLHNKINKRPDFRRRGLRPVPQHMDRHGSRLVFLQHDLHRPGVDQMPDRTNRRIAQPQPVLHGGVDRRHGVGAKAALDRDRARLAVNEKAPVRGVAVHRADDAGMMAQV